MFNPFWSPSEFLYYSQIGNAKQVREDFKYQTPLRPARRIVLEFITLERDGRMLIRSGYAWDGASGPTIDTLDTIIASCVHDAGYALLETGGLDLEDDRRKIDQMFYDQLLKDGMIPLRAFAWFKAVRIAGGRYAQVGSGHKILRAPKPWSVIPPEQFSPFPGMRTSI